MMPSESMMGEYYMIGWADSSDEIEEETPIDEDED
jgi:hypothetical protein